MNHLFDSGFLNVTEIFIRCMLLNKCWYNYIHKKSILFDAIPLRKQTLFLDKGVKSECYKC